MAICPVVSAENAAADEKYERAIKLVETVIGGEAGFDAEGEVLRADFVSVIGKLFKHEDISGQASGYADVAKGDKGANEIYTALKLGYLSKAEHFYPQKAMSYGAAVKLAVCYAGYQVPAESKGGYPTGYNLLASSNGLLKNIKAFSNDDAISGRDAAVLLYNLLLSDEISASYVGEKFYYYKTGETNLSALHKIYVAEGVVNSTFLGNITKTEHNTDKKQIQIEGVAYSAESCDESILGKNAVVFYKEETLNAKEAICVFCADNTEIGLKLTDISSVSKNEISYVDEASGDEEEISLDSGEVVLVYNGRYAPFDKNLFLNREGIVRTVDNDEDGDAEVVFIESYTYIKVESVSPTEKFIGAEKSAESLNLKGNDIDWQILNFSGQKISLYDLKQGDLLAVKKSADAKLVTLTLCNEKIGAQVDEVNTGFKEITLDGNVYKMSRHFIINKVKNIKAGSVGRFTIGLYGTVADFTEDSSVMRYAYLLSYQRKTNTFGQCKIKMLMRNGDIEILTLSDKITVDGGAEKVSDNDFYNALENGTYPSPSLVKISLSEDRMVKKVDFPALYTDDLGDASNLPSDNKLLKYDFGVTGFAYRSTSQSCSTYFNVKNTTIFKIPKDITLEEYLDVGTATMLTNGRSYTMEAYDVNEAGTAGAVVWKVNNVNPTLDRYDNTYIIEKVTDGINADGIPVKLVHCWSMGDFKIFYLEDDVNIGKANNAPLSGGDLARIDVDTEGKIRAIAVDFDASSGVAEVNTALEGTNSYVSSMYGGGDISFTYQYGKLYRTQDGFASLSNVKDIYGDYDFSLVNRRNVYIQTNNIIKYDSDSGLLRPITADELKSYVSCGDEAHYVVVRQANLNVNSVYVYE